LSWQKFLLASAYNNSIKHKDMSSAAENTPVAAVAGQAQAVNNAVQQVKAEDDNLLCQWQGCRNRFNSADELYVSYTIIP
jgi:hypothetical protein